MSTVIVITPPPTKPASSDEEQKQLDMTKYKQLLQDAKSLTDAGFSVTLVTPPK